VEEEAAEVEVKEGVRLGAISNLAFRCAGSRFTKSSVEDDMKRIAIAVLFVAFMILFASTAATQAQTAGSITVNKNGSPASGVSVVLDLSNMGKAGTTGTSTTGTTDSNGSPSNVLDLSNMGKAHYDVYEKTCVNGETVVVVVPAGQTPKDDGCKHRRIGGFIWWGDGNDHVTIDTGTHTATNSHSGTGTVTGTGTGTHINTNEYMKYEIGGGFNFYHETSEPFYGGYGTFAYHPKPCWGVVGDITVDHHSETGFSSTMEWFMAGPRIQHPTTTFTPYGQLLLGGIHSSFSSGTTSGSANAFGMKLGGGLDWNISPKWGVRLGQFDYVYSHFGGQSQSNFDYSAGFVYHFGGSN
jgi:opacity protein-like surface antigen